MPLGKDAAPSLEEPSDRLYFVENLRTWFITLFREQINRSGTFTRFFQQHS